MWFKRHRLIIVLMVLFVNISTGRAYGLVIRGYFPVCQGNFWNFAQPDKKTLSSWAINGSFWLRNAGRVFILMQDNGRFLCMKEDWEGLRIYAEYGPGKYLIPDEPLLFLPRHIDANPDAVPHDLTVDLTVYTDTTGWKNFEQTGKDIRPRLRHRSLSLLLEAQGLWKLSGDRYLGPADRILQKVYIRNGRADRSIRFFRE